MSEGIEFSVFKAFIGLIQGLNWPRGKLYTHAPTSTYSTKVSVEGNRTKSSWFPGAGKAVSRILFGMIVPRVGQNSEKWMGCAIGCATIYSLFRFLF